MSEDVADHVESVLGLRSTFEEVGTGAIVEKNNRSFWIDGDTLERELAELPGNVRDQLQRGRGIRYLESELDGVHKFRGERRAPEFLRALEDELEGMSYKLQYLPDVAEETLAGDVRVPVWLASEGKYFVAAFLAAHGFDNTSISNALDVAESTVKVNLSKFKAGDL